MNDHEKQIREALEAVLPHALVIINDEHPAIKAARAALTAAKAGGWQDVKDCPDGDAWFALSCGHVVMGWKQGDLLDWESMCDHDCCHDAHAVKAQPVATPTHPDLIS